MGREQKKWASGAVNTLALGLHPAGVKAMSNVSKNGRSNQPTSFRCVLECGKDLYNLMPLRNVHPEVAKVAYRLRKQTGGCEVYDVRLTPQGHAECDCKGCTRWHHCKHLRMLVALGCLPAGSIPVNGRKVEGKPAPKPQPRPQPKPAAEVEEDPFARCPSEPSPWAECLKPATEKKPAAHSKPRYRSTADFARNDPEGYAEMMANDPGLPPMTECEMEALAGYHDAE
jgi:hypothetical protein